MKQVISRISFIMGLLLSSLLGFKRLDACGMNWTQPQDHFDGVNEYGFLSYWSNLGAIDLGDGVQIPLVIGFQSDREHSSPYLGKGWVLSLLDSNIVQDDDNNFTVLMPDGWTVNFWRPSPTDKELGGQGGWKAEIDGDTITAWAECGWRLTYTKGKLTSIGLPQNRSLDFIYENGKVERIMYGAQAVLEINSEPNTGMVTGIVFNGKTVQLEQGNKPYVQSLNGHMLIGQIVQSLDKISLPDGSVVNYKFGVDDKLQPTLNITSKGKGDRLITWDPLTKNIIRDNDWTYDITPNGPGNASITRTTQSGQRELWFYNPSVGENTTKSSNGPEIITQQFTSGLLAGKLRRKLEIDSSGVTTIAYQASYDEAGRLIRERFNQSKEGGGDRTISYQYFDDGRCKITISENQRDMSRIFDGNGLLVGDSQTLLK